jgi:pseudouridine-5'-phosphate glycosidase
MVRTRFIAYFILVSLLLIQACRVSVSFTGGSVHPDAKTISVHFIKNNATTVVPTLSQQLTDAIKDKFTGGTRLNLVNNGGDLDISGEIVNYAITPVAIQANETASQNRLTITVNIRFTNKFDEKQNFESTFSRYSDYDSKMSLSKMDDVIKIVNDYLVDDIFNKAVVNW